MATKKMIRAKEIGRRLTGISGFGFGANWEYPADERAIVREFITLLEDRRTLYSPYNVEVEGDVRWSVDKIREYASDALSKLSDSSPASASIRAIRAACRKYLTDRHDFPNLIIGRQGEAGWLVGLGELRATVGIHIATLAAAYQIDVEQELSSIFPADVSDD